jgi:hypothetical protein
VAERRRLLHALDEQRTAVLAAAAAADSHAAALATVRLEGQQAVIAAADSAAAAAALVEAGLRQELAAQGDGAMEAAMEASAEMAAATIGLSDADADIGVLLLRQAMDAEAAEAATRSSIQARAEAVALSIRLDEVQAKAAAAGAAERKAVEDAKVARATAEALAEAAAAAALSGEAVVRQVHLARDAERLALIAAVAEADDTAQAAVADAASAVLEELVSRRAAEARALAADESLAEADAALATADAERAAEAEALRAALAEAEAEAETAARLAELERERADAATNSALAARAAAAQAATQVDSAVVAAQAETALRFVSNAERMVEAEALRVTVAEAEAGAETAARLAQLERERADAAARSASAARAAAAEAAAEAGREAAEAAERHARDSEAWRERAEAADEAAAVALARADVAESSIRLEAASGAHAMAEVLRSAACEREAQISSLVGEHEAQLCAARAEASRAMVAMGEVELECRRRLLEAGVLTRELGAAELLCETAEERSATVTSQAALDARVAADAALAGEASALALRRALKDSEAAAVEFGARQAAAAAAATEAEAEARDADAALASMSHTVAVADAAAAAAAAVAAAEMQARRVLEEDMAALKLREATLRSEASAAAVALNNALDGLRQLEADLITLQSDHAAALAAMATEVEAARGRATSGEEVAMALRLELRQAEEAQAEVQAEAAWRLAEAAEAAEAASAVARREAESARADAAHAATLVAEAAARARRVEAAAQAAVAENELRQALVDGEMELSWAERDRATLRSSVRDAQDAAARAVTDGVVVAGALRESETEAAAAAAAAAKAAHAHAEAVATAGRAETAAQAAAAALRSKLGDALRREAALEEAAADLARRADEAEAAAEESERRAAAQTKMAALAEEEARLTGIAARGEAAMASAAAAAEERVRRSVAAAEAAAQARSAEKIAEAVEAAEARVAAEKAINAQLLLDEQAATLRRLGAALADRVTRSGARRALHTWAHPVRMQRAAAHQGVHAASRRGWRAFWDALSEMRRHEAANADHVTLQLAVAARISAARLSVSLCAWQLRSAAALEMNRLAGTAAARQLSSRLRRAMASLVSVTAESKFTHGLGNRAVAALRAGRSRIFARAVARLRNEAEEKSALNTVTAAIRRRFRLGLLRAGFRAFRAKQDERNALCRVSSSLFRYECERLLARWRRHRDLAWTRREVAASMPPVSRLAAARVLRRMRRSSELRHGALRARRRCIRSRLHRGLRAWCQAYSEEGARAASRLRGAQARRLVLMQRARRCLASWSQRLRQAGLALTLGQRRIQRRAWATLAASTRVHALMACELTDAECTMRTAALLRGTTSLRSVALTRTINRSRRALANGHVRQVAVRRVLIIFSAHAASARRIHAARYLLDRSAMRRVLARLTVARRSASHCIIASRHHSFAVLRRALARMDEAAQASRRKTLIGRLATGHREAHAYSVAVSVWRTAAVKHRAQAEACAVAWLRAQESPPAPAVARPLCRWMDATGSRCRAPAARHLNIRGTWRRWERVVQSRHADSLRSESATWCLRFCEARNAMRHWAEWCNARAARTSRTRSLLRSTRDPRTVHLLAWRGFSVDAGMQCRRLLLIGMSVQTALERRRLMLCTRTWRAAAAARAARSHFALHAAQHLAATLRTGAFVLWRMRAARKLAIARLMAAVAASHAVTVRRRHVLRWRKALLATRRVRRDAIASLLARSHAASAPPAHSRAMLLADGLAATRRIRAVRAATAHWRSAVALASACRRSAAAAATASSRRTNRRALSAWLAVLKRKTKCACAASRAFATLSARHVRFSIRRWVREAGIASFNAQLAATSRRGRLAFCAARFRRRRGALAAARAISGCGVNASHATARRSITLSLRAWHTFAIGRRSHRLALDIAADRARRTIPVQSTLHALRSWHSMARARSVRALAEPGSDGRAARLNHYYRSLQVLQRALVAREAVFPTGRASTERDERAAARYSKAGGSCPDGLPVTGGSRTSRIAMEYSTSTGTPLAGALAEILHDGVDLSAMSRILSSTPSARPTDTAEASSMVAAALAWAGRSGALAAAEAGGHDIVGAAMDQGCQLVAMREMLAEADEARRRAQQELAEERARREQVGALLVAAHDQVSSMSAALDAASLQREADAVFSAARERERKRRVAAALRAQRYALAVQLVREQVAAAAALGDAETATRQAQEAACVVADMARSAMSDTEEAHRRAVAESTATSAAALEVAEAKTEAALLAQRAAEERAETAEAVARREQGQLKAIAGSLQHAAAEHKIQMRALVEELSASEATVCLIRQAAAAAAVEAAKAAEVSAERAAKALAESVAAASCESNERAAAAMALAKAAADDCEAARSAAAQASGRWAGEAELRAEAEARAVEAERRAAVAVESRVAAENRAAAAAEAATLARRTLQSHIKDSAAAATDADKRLAELKATFEERERSMREQCDAVSATASTLRRKLILEAEAAAAALAEARRASECDREESARRVREAEARAASSVADAAALREALTSSRAAEAAALREAEAAGAALQHPRDARRGGGLAAAERDGYERQLADARAELEALRRMKEPLTPAPASTPGSASPATGPDAPRASTDIALPRSPVQAAGQSDLAFQTPAVIELRQALRLSEERRLADAEELDTQVRYTLQLHGQLHRQRASEARALDALNEGGDESNVPTMIPTATCVDGTMDFLGAIGSPVASLLEPSMQGLLPGLSPGKENDLAHPMGSTAPMTPARGDARAVMRRDIKPSPHRGQPSNQRQPDSAMRFDSRVHMAVASVTQRVLTNAAVNSRTPARGLPTAPLAATNSTPRVRV